MSMLEDIQSFHDDNDLAWTVRQILDYLIEQERAAEQRPWCEEDVKAVVEPNDSMVNKLIELKDQRDEARANLDAALARIAELTERREKGESAQSLRVELKSAKDRIAELENTIADLALYKAGIEALPVGQYLRLDVWPGDSARHGRFIPAREGE